jgi:hypothetical protein
LVIDPGPAEIQLERKTPSCADVLFGHRARERAR